MAAAACGQAEIGKKRGTGEGQCRENRKMGRGAGIRQHLVVNFGFSCAAVVRNGERIDVARETVSLTIL